MRLQSDLLDLLDAAVDGQLDHCPPSWDPRPALCVVMAAAGYPEQVRQGDRISLPPNVSADQHIFHAGSRAQDGQILTSGGRVLCAAARADNISQAQAQAYALAAQIHWDGAQYRRDIGYRAINR